VNPLERGYYWGTRFSDERKIFAFAPGLSDLAVKYLPSRSVEVSAFCGRLSGAKANILRCYYWGTRFSDERKIFAFAPDNLPQNAETSTDRDGKYFTAKSDNSAFCGRLSGAKANILRSSLKRVPQ
jgi:hypothetical protein